MGKKSGSRSRMNSPDHISESLKNTFSGLKYLSSLMWIRDAGMEKIRIRDPGWKKVGSGIGVRGKHPGSATQIKTLFCWRVWDWANATSTCGLVQTPIYGQRSKFRTVFCGKWPIGAEISPHGSYYITVNMRQDQGFFVMCYIKNGQFGFEYEGVFTNIILVFIVYWCDYPLEVH